MTAVARTVANINRMATMMTVVVSRATRTSITTINTMTREATVRTAMREFHLHDHICHPLTAEQCETPPPARL